MDFEPEKLVRSPFFVGLVGASIAAFRFVPGANYAEKSLNAFCGALIAGYLSPPLVEWLGLTAETYKSGAAFLFGVLGMAVTSATLRGISELPIAAAVASWITRKG